MRILKVHSYYTQSGGEDTVFRAEAALLRSRGHEVIEYLEDNNKIKSMNKAAVALQTLWSHSSHRKLKGFLGEAKPDVVHFHNTFPLISPSAYYACQELDIPVVQTLDNQRLICPASSFYRDGKLCLDCLGRTPPWPGVLHACYHDSCLHTAIVASMLTLHRWLGTWQTKIDTFLCSTNFYRDLFVKAGFPPEKIVVMPHFVQDTPDETRQEGKYALFIGRLDPEKGIRTLLAAWKSIEIPLLIRGSGQLEQEAKAFIETHQIKNIKFVERLDDDGLHQLRKNARFLVLPSEGYYETFGMVAVECFAQSVPVIASNIGVMTEIVHDRKTGLHFQPGNAQDLADKVRWAWAHSHELAEMGKNARREYELKYTADKSYITLMDVYSRLISA
jgi:glycosyltransferase involved in cell wall biosynthesis